jgi:ElaB/YqjD/DUF883 family membrane-anchored ribosome-binding protein
MAIKIPIISEFDSKGLDKAVNEFKSLEGVGKKTGYAIKKAAVPAAAAIGALGFALGKATQAAIDDQAAQVELARTLSVSASATKAQVAATETMISKMAMASGIADDELRPALASLVRGTKDISKAQEGLALAMDISTATGKDLGTVSDALSKAYAGNYKGLKALSPEMSALIKDGADLNQIMDVLGGTFGGATAKAAGTAAGQMKILKNSLNETTESIGAALLPVVEAVLPIINKFAKWAQDNPKVFLAIAAAIGVVAAAIVATNIAMALNPFSLIAAGVALLIAALVAAYAKFEWFKTGVNGIINIVLGAFENMVNGAIMAVNAIIRAYNSIPILSNVSTISHVDLPTVGAPAAATRPAPGRNSIPRFAEGGIVTQPLIGMIGEAGPEAIIPLSKMGDMGGGITVNVNGGLATSAEIGQAIVNAIRAYNRSAGPANIQVA